MGWEWDVLNFIQEHMRSELLDSVMPALTSLGNGGMVWILLCVCLLIGRKHRRAGIVLAVAMAVDALLCNGLLKPIIGRARPFDVNPDILLLIAPPGDFSFPSGHTAVSFAAVAALYLCREKYWYLGAFLAVAIAFSRLYLYVHYPTDILGGMVVGTASGIIAFQACKKAEAAWRFQKERRG